MILVWSRKAIAGGSHTWRSCQEMEEPVNNNSGTYIVYNSHVTCSNSSFSLTMVTPHISLLCFPLVMLSASHWLLAQAQFCGRTHLPLSPNSTTPTVQVIFRYLWPDTPVFNINCIHSTCKHGEILAITLWILSLSGCSCLNILWFTTPVDMMTFQWSYRSYQSICQQHLPYSHPQVMLIYYMCVCVCVCVCIWEIFCFIQRYFNKFCKKDFGWLVG